VLDNARDAEQIRPLLPGTPGCFVLVTSRSQLPGWWPPRGAHPLSVELLPADDARQLLTRRMGAARVASDPSAVDAIITGCAGSRWRSRSVAARAVTNPGFPLASLAGELRRERGRDLQDARTDLDAFAGGDLATDVRSVFSWSYRTLSSPAARLFRLLGLHAGPDITVGGAASLAGWPVRVTEEMLTELARAHLVAEQRPGRFTFHDLLRAYATELAHAYDEEDARHAAVRRMLDFYLHSSMNANWQLDPSREPVTPIAMSDGARHDTFGTIEEAMAWFEAEHMALMAAVRQAESGGFDEHVWQLAWAVSTYNDRLGHWIDQITIMRMALDATRRLDDRNATAIAHRGPRPRVLPAGPLRRGRHPLQAGPGDLPRARRQARAGAGLPEPVLGGRAAAPAPGGARVRAARAAAVPELNHTLGHASTLNDMGWFHSMLGNYDEALVACREALALFEKLNLHSAQANTWDTVGFAYHKQGSYADAIASYEYALELFTSSATGTGTPRRWATSATPTPRWTRPTWPATRGGAPWRRSRSSSTPTPTRFGPSCAPWTPSRPVARLSPGRTARPAVFATTPGRPLSALVAFAAAPPPGRSTAASASCRRPGRGRRAGRAGRGTGRSTVATPSSHSRSYARYCTGQRLASRRIVLPSRASLVRAARSSRRRG
jgi:hypothetical protein